MRVFSFAFVAVLMAALMLGVAATAVADEANGRINAVLADDQTFTFTTKDGIEHSMSLDLTGEVRINDRLSQLDDLNEGDEVEVTFEIRDGLKIASRVNCTR